MDIRVWVCWEYDSMWYLGIVIQIHDDWHTIEFDSGLVETLELAKLGGEDWYVAEPDSMPIHQLSAAPDDDDDASSSSLDNDTTWTEAQAPSSRSAQAAPRCSERKPRAHPNYVKKTETEEEGDDDDDASVKAPAKRYPAPTARGACQSESASAKAGSTSTKPVASRATPVESGASSAKLAASGAASAKAGSSSTAKAPSASPEALPPSTERATPRDTAVAARSLLSAKWRSPPDDVYESSSSWEVVLSPPKAPAAPRRAPTRRSSQDDDGDEAWPEAPAKQHPASTAWGSSLAKAPRALAERCSSLAYDDAPSSSWDDGRSECNTNRRAEPDSSLRFLTTSCVSAVVHPLGGECLRLFRFARPDGFVLERARVQRFPRELSYFIWRPPTTLWRRSNRLGLTALVPFLLARVSLFERARLFVPQRIVSASPQACARRTWRSPPKRTTRRAALSRQVAL